MVYYALLDISDLSDENVDLIRQCISVHFTDRANLKRKESVAAKALLCHTLQTVFGVTDFLVDCDEKGKPFIVGENLYFNISHSEKFVLCACGGEQVGCDIQTVSLYKKRVAERFFTAEESSFLEDCDDKDRVFTRLWTLKESLLKYSGDGIGGGLDSCDFSECVHDDTFSKNGLIFNTFENTEYVMSFCSETGELSQFQIDIKEMIKFGK